MNSTSAAFRLIGRSLLIASLLLGTTPDARAVSDEKTAHEKTAQEKTAQRKSRNIADVQLSRNGALQYRVCDGSGNALSKQRLQIRFSGRQVAVAESDAEGRVVIHGLRPGIHEVRVAGQSQIVRFWNSEMAPPAALQQPAFVLSGDQVRGQYAPVMMEPVVLAAGVAATALIVVLVGKSSASDHQPRPASP